MFHFWLWARQPFLPAELYSLVVVLSVSNPTIRAIAFLAHCFLPVESLGQLAPLAFPFVISASAVVAAVGQDQVPCEWNGIWSGADISCGITARHEAQCWGNGILAVKSTQPPAGHRWTSLTQAYRHMCGITDNNHAVCWAVPPLSNTAYQDDRSGLERIEAVIIGVPTRNVSDVHSRHVLSTREGTVGGSLAKWAHFTIL